MNVSMIQALAEQHKALKAFHKQCGRNGTFLTATADQGYDLKEVLLDGVTTALIMPEVCKALLFRIKETEEAIRSNAKRD